MDLDGLVKSLSSSDPYSIPKTIVFFGTKKHVVQAYILLRQRALCKHYVGAYHASLTDETKHFVTRQFMTNDSEMRVLCSTIAFGMVITVWFCKTCVTVVNLQGIDISVVVVYWVPDTISQFYQVW